MHDTWHDTESFPRDIVTILSCCEETESVCLHALVLMSRLLGLKQKVFSHIRTKHIAPLSMHSLSDYFFADPCDRSSIKLKLLSTDSKHANMVSSYVAPSILSARKKQRPRGEDKVHHMLLPATSAHDIQMAFLCGKNRMKGPLFP